ncbi:MAG: hypothetical protein ACPGO5_04705 [Patescibacteria group bacterium]
MKNAIVFIAMLILTNAIFAQGGPTRLEQTVVNNGTKIVSLTNQMGDRVAAELDFEKRLADVEARLTTGSAGSAPATVTVIDTAAVRAFLAAEIKRLGGVITAADLDTAKAEWFLEGHQKHWLSMEGSFKLKNGKLIVEQLKEADANAQTTADDALSLATANNGNILDIELTLTDAPLDSSLASAQLRKEAQERLNQNVELKLQQLLSSSNRPAIVVQ